MDEHVSFDELQTFVLQKSSHQQLLGLEQK